MLTQVEQKKATATVKAIRQNQYLLSFEERRAKTARDSCNFAEAAKAQLRASKLRRKIKEDTAFVMEARNKCTPVLRGQDRRVVNSENRR